MRVYSITNKINGKMYIGMTKHTVDVRLSQHLKIAKNIPHYKKKNRKVYPIHRAIAKYGIDNFTIEELGTYSSHKEMCDGERYYIAKFNSTNRKVGYNLCEGGEGLIHTEEISRKKSEAMCKLNEEGKLPHTKLNSKKALEIKKLIMSGNFTNREIAKKYGVSFNVISCIQKNKIYKKALKDTPVLKHGKDGWCQPGYSNRGGIKNINSAFSEDDIKVIIERYKNGDKINDIASDYGVVRQTVSGMLRNKTYVGMSINARKNLLSSEKVLEIKQFILDNQDKSFTEISKIFNVSIDKISRIALNKIYKKILEKTPIITRKNNVIKIEYYSDPVK